MIGDRLKELRESKGLTQAKIAQDPDFGVKQGTLAAYERNAREPNIETIVRLARYFDVTTDYLLDVSAHKTPEMAVTGYTIPLSDAAIEYLKESPLELLKIVDAILTAPGSTFFLEEMRSYLIALQISPEELPDFLMPLADHLSRGPDADADVVKAYVGWKWEALCKELGTLCSDVYNRFEPAGYQHMGRPKKSGSYKKKASPIEIEGEANNQESDNLGGDADGDGRKEGQ